MPRAASIAQNEAEVQFAVGSGRQGIAYLIERDGFLFQSPITWYPRERRWDLSPGYEKSNLHFDRPIQPDCLFCHANRVEPVAGTVNRYRPPIFRGHAIGCERCHGPGELHVKRPDVGRRPGHDDRQPRRAGALAPGRRLRAMPPERPAARLAGWTVGMRTIGPGCRSIGSGRCSSGRRARPRTGSSARSSRCTRAVASAPARAGSGASPATIRIGSRSPRRRWPITGIAAWSATPIGVAACRRAVRLGRSRDDDCIGCHMPRSSDSDIIHVADDESSHPPPRGRGRSVPDPRRGSARQPASPW